jgi:hypothetical protein
MDKNEKFKLFNSLLSTAKGLLGINNLVAQSTDGTELDFGSDVETMDQVQVGTPCSVDGSFVMPDGSTIVSEGKEVISITPAASMDDQKDAEIEALKAQIAELANSVTTLTNSVTEKDVVIAEFKPLVKEFEKLKNSFSDHKPVAAVVPAVEEKQKEDEKRLTFKIN